MTGGASVPLAWRNLTADRGRLARSAAGIGFAVLLMFIQLGFREAFIDSSLALPRALDGELIVVSATKYRIGHNDTFPRRRLTQALAAEGVAEAAPVHAEWKRSVWKNPQTRESFTMQVLAFDPDRPVFAIPEIEAARHALKMPDTVLMDSRGRRFLGEAEIGLETELARREVKIVGTFPLGPDFTNDGTLITSERTFFNLFPNLATGLAETGRAEIGVIRLRPGADAARVKERLAAALPNDVVVLTKAEFVALERAFQNSVSPVGPIFAFGTLIGFAVGMLISYQIMFTDLSDHMPQYATLKAIGYPNRYLVGVVLQQAAFYALAGFVPAIALAALVFWAVGEVALVPMEMGAGLGLLCLALTVGMCVLSGLIAVRRVLSADPAEVF